MQEFKITEEDKNKRVDQFLIEKMGLSRSKIQAMIKNDEIQINGKPVKNSKSIKVDDVITASEYVEELMDIKPEDLDLEIVYEDEDVLVVNKRNGMVVHPAVGNPSGTLVNGLVFHSKELSDLNGEFRPGIVHRIDAYTTGLLVVAKNNKAHASLAKQLEEKTTHRKYIALVWGVVNTDTGTIDAPIGRDSNDRKKMAVTASNSKESVTNFKVIERFKDTTLLELVLETGRTHQIRVHMNYIGYPIVNDPVYGRRKKFDESGQCLHAAELGFIHPKTGKYMEFSVPLPECFVNILNIVKEN